MRLEGNCYSWCDAAKTHLGECAVARALKSGDGNEIRATTRRALGCCADFGVDISPLDCGPLRDVRLNGKMRGLAKFFDESPGRVNSPPA